MDYMMLYPRRQTFSDNYLGPPHVTILLHCKPSLSKNVEGMKGLMIIFISHIQQTIT
jgi:hypothetical protein